MDFDPEYELRVPYRSEGKCQYRRPNWWSRLLGGIFWTGLGATLGALIGWQVTKVQMENEKDTLQREKTLAWIDAVVCEIDYNICWGTDSFGTTMQGDSTLIMRRFQYSALAAFLSQTPELRLRNPATDSLGRIVMERINSVSQMIDIRNQIKNIPIGTIENNTSSLKAHLEQISRYNEGIAVGAGYVYLESGALKKLLLAERDSILVHDK